jgi:hypothetical protein
VAVKWDGLGPYSDHKPSRSAELAWFGAYTAPNEARLAPRQPTFPSMPAVDVR